MGQGPHGGGKRATRYDENIPRRIKSFALSPRCLVSWQIFFFLKIFERVLGKTFFKKFSLSVLPDKQQFTSQWFPLLCVLNIF